jgi:hypothetical protein
LISLGALTDLPLAGLDCFRRHMASPGVRGFREWHHFGIVAGDIDVLVNFNLLDSVEGAAPEARVAALVRDGEWRGALERYEPAAVGLRVGRLSATFGESSLAFEGGAYRLSIKLDAGRVEAALVLRPLALPFIARNVEIAAAKPLHWLVVPRLLASGRISVEGRVRMIHDAMAYHDHNWGHWGADCGWDWGFGLPSDPADPWSLVFARLDNRTRSVTRLQALLLWNGAVLRRVIRDGDLRFDRHGLVRRPRLHKLPPVMGLLSPGDLTEAPRRLRITFESDGDHGVAVFEAEDVAQIIVPDDGRSGLQIINEVSASYHLDGTIRGTRVLTTGRAIFEHAHA